MQLENSLLYKLAKTSTVFPLLQTQWEKMHCNTDTFLFPEGKCRKAVVLF